MSASANTSDGALGVALALVRPLPESVSVTVIENVTERDRAIESSSMIRSLAMLDPALVHDLDHVAHQAASNVPVEADLQSLVAETGA